MSEAIPNRIKIGDEMYVKESQKVQSAEGLQFCIVRTCSAGVFAGYLKARVGREVTLVNARRIWYWAGASSLSQLAMEGTSNPEKCKFPCAVDEVHLLEAIEIIPCTETAQESIEGVPVWKS